MQKYVRESVPSKFNTVLHGGTEEQCNEGKNAKIQTEGGRLDVFDFKILICSGERREESAKRSTYPEWSVDKNLTTKRRKAYRWRPMLDFKVNDVWSVIKNSGIEAHEAYQLGCDRLGCTMCIFAGDCGRMAKDVKIACRENPEQYEELDKLEADTGFTMSIQGIRVRDIIKTKG